MNRPGFLSLVLAASLFATPRGSAAGALVDVLKARQARIDTILARYPADLPPEVKTDVGRAIADLIDFPEMGRAALGEEWGKHGEAERRDYVAAFEELVRANILRRVDIYRTESIEYQDETIEGEKGSAKSVVKSRNATTEVVYALHTVAGKWRIADYSIDGVSAVKNYRSQFAKLIEKRGFAGMVERLKKRREEIDAGK